MALEEVGFSRVIEAGLGRGNQEYLAFQIHTFPAKRPARRCWGRDEKVSDPDVSINQPAYQALAAEGIDQCGLTMVAGRTVGAPFVGAATAAIVVAELLRMVMGEHRYKVIDGNLRSLAYWQVVMNDLLAEPFNPGYTGAK